MTKSFDRLTPVFPVSFDIIDDDFDRVRSVFRLFSSSFGLFRNVFRIV